MSDYSKTTDFTAKDSSNAVIYGAEHDTEYDAIATASATKADKSTPSATNNLAMLTASGNLDDSGIATDGSGGITISGSTIDNSVIGGTTPAAGTFTTLAATSWNAPVSKVKTSDETVSASNTFQDDDELTGFSLTAGKQYKVTLRLVAAQSSSGGIETKLVFSQTPQYLTAVLFNYTTITSSTWSTSTSGVGTTLNSTSKNMLTVTGVFQANATTGGTLKLQWAQSVATGTTTLYTGSCMEIQQLN